MAFRHGRFGCPAENHFETPPVRDASSLQRRRRLMLLQGDAMLNADADGVSRGDNSAGDDQFFRDCRAIPDRELWIRVPGKPDPLRVPLNRPFLIVGRNSSCDVQIEDPGIHDFELYIQWIEGRVVCAPLGPSTQAEPAPAFLSAKPKVFGSLSVCVPGIEETLATLDPQQRQARLGAEIPLVQLKFSAVQQQDNFWSVDREITLVGRGAHCKLRLDHDAIPATLAAIVRSSTGCWLIDLSMDGLVKTNHVARRVVALDIGDRLEFGPFQAEVTTAPISLKGRQESSSELQAAAIRKLSDEHRQRLGVLKKSLGEVQLYLDAEHLNAVPGLKSALADYVQGVERHHRAIQMALDSLASHDRVALEEESVSNR